MFDEFQLAIVAAAVIVFILVLYIVMRRGLESESTDTQTEIRETKEDAAQEKVKPVSTPKPSDKKAEAAAVVPDIDTTESVNRRKSDKILPKRSAPEHVKITKQNFSEFAGERVLVAEDNPINQKVIIGLLADSGIELVMANDGQEALDILEKDSDFVMILMDAHMPRIDGFEATRAIRQNVKYDHILIVALSGDTASDDIQKMKDAGMDEQLAKPLRMDALYKIFYAYAGKDTNKDHIEQSFGTIKSLDTLKGIETCGGDESFYREILSEFYTDYAGSSELLGQYLRSKNFQAANALLLDIIGVSENIGARALSASASNIKMALNDIDEHSYFSLYDQYRVNLEKLMEDIKAYLK